MNIRFYNGRIMSMENGTQITENEIWVSGNKIIYNGKSKPFDLVWDREIDLDGNLLMPGFKNAHTHSAMTFLRSMADDLPLNKWLNDLVFPLEDKLAATDVYYLSKLAILEYLSSGITANFDMYFDTDMLVKASMDCGFRTVVCTAVSDDSQSIQEVEALYKKYNKPDSLISAMLGFHAEYTCSQSLLEKIAMLAKKYQAPVYTHISETEQEVATCKQKYGLSPVEFLDKLGIFDFGGGGFHCVHFSEEDIKIFKQKNLYIITNPASNAKLASGIAPLCDFDRAGIQLAIGTDGPASNNSLDMFKEMFLATALQKLKYSDAAAMPCEKVLHMATVGGAHAMGLYDCDTLAVGKKADLIVLDLSCPNMQPLNNIAKNIVYAGSKQNILLTMVDGKILYENNNYYVNEEKLEIFKNANKIVKRITK